MSDINRFILAQDEYQGDTVTDGAQEEGAAVVKSVSDVETDEQARALLREVADGIEDYMMMEFFYEFAQEHGSSPQEAVRVIVYVFGLDLT